MNTLNLNIMKAILVLIQLHVCTWAKSNRLNFSEGDTILPYHIITILMHVDTQDKSVLSPSYLGMAWEAIISNCHHKHVHSWYTESRSNELNIFTKTENKKSSYQLPLPWSLHQISSLLPFTYTTEWCENKDIASVSWTKLEFAKQFIQRRRLGNIGSSLDKQ